MKNLVISTFLNRIREPSSWGGIAVLLAMFGLSNEQAGAVTELLAAGAAIASVFMAEKSPATSSPPFTMTHRPMRSGGAVVGRGEN